MAFSRLRLCLQRALQCTKRFWHTLKFKVMGKRQTLLPGSRILQEAVEIVTRAVAEDEKGNYVEALQLYEESLQCFYQFETKSERVQAKLKAKCELYEFRVEQIKAYLNEQKEKQKEDGDDKKLKPCSFSEEGYTLCLSAIEIVTKATNEDKNKNYEESLRLYEQSLEMFKTVLQNESLRESTAESLRAKIAQYQERAGNIRFFLKMKEEKNKIQQPLDDCNHDDHICDMLTRDVFEKAIAMANEATQEDKNKNYEEALLLYEKCIKYFNYVKKNGAKGKIAKEAIRSKCALYEERAEKIRIFLEKGNEEGESEEEDDDDDNDRNNAEEI